MKKLFECLVFRVYILCTLVCVCKLDALDMGYTKGKVLLPRDFIFLFKCHHGSFKYTSVIVVIKLV